jgi:serine/threonine protein kinase
MAESNKHHFTADNGDGILDDDWDLLETAGLDWSGRGDSHIDFGKDEVLPLSEGSLLGYGIRGAVYSTKCKGGEVVAWKRVYCKHGITKSERKEIDVLKRLSHRHIIKLVGSYTQGPWLGLLLWPVAVMDLATFLNGVDGIMTNWIKSPVPWEQQGELEEQVKRLCKLSITSPWNNLHTSSQEIYGMALRCNIGCLTGAVAYLHKHSVRHKDLKPANILLYPEGLRLTDFGTATDFSEYSQSATDGGERGTLKYCSPEAAAWGLCGRASDIFALGCVFIEMLAIANGHSLDTLKKNRPDGHHSFHANIDHVKNWIRSTQFSTRDSILMVKLISMLSEDPKSRPTIDDVQEHLSLTDLYALPCHVPEYHGQCCRSTASSTVCKLSAEHASQLHILKQFVSNLNEHILLFVLSNDWNFLSALERIRNGAYVIPESCCQCGGIPRPDLQACTSCKLEQCLMCNFKKGGPIDR